MHLYTCKLMLFASFIFVLAGCGATSFNGVPSAVSGKPVSSVSASMAGAVATVRESQAASVVSADESVNSAVPPVSFGIERRNRGTCWWVLVSTGEKFCSKDAALSSANERKLEDRRVEEICFDRDRIATR